MTPVTFSATGGSWWLNLRWWCALSPRSVRLRGGWVLLSSAPLHHGPPPKRPRRPCAVGYHYCISFYCTGWRVGYSMYCTGISHSLSSRYLGYTLLTPVVLVVALTS